MLEKQTKIIISVSKFKQYFFENCCFHIISAIPRSRIISFQKRVTVQRSRRCLQATRVADKNFVFTFLFSDSLTLQLWKDRKDFERNPPSKGSLALQVSVL
jgi:hypothetical protein